MVSNKRRRIFYCEVSHMPGVLVFADAAKAERISRINNALKTAKTWGEFKALMAPKDFAQAVKSLRKRPSELEPFDMGGVPGVSDGDYPPWLQAEMEMIIPQEILQEFGSLESTFVSGSYWEIPVACEHEIVAELRRRGYIVERRDDLDFH
jgi:hypothetical protein